MAIRVNSVEEDIICSFNIFFRNFHSLNFWSFLTKGGVGAVTRCNTTVKFIKDGVKFEKSIFHNLSFRCLLLSTYPFLFLFIVFPVILLFHHPFFFLLPTMAEKTHKKISENLIIKCPHNTASQLNGCKYIKEYPFLWIVCFTHSIKNLF